MAKNFWHDPVWSKVIATIITTLLFIVGGAAYAYFKNGCQSPWLNSTLVYSALLIIIGFLIILLIIQHYGIFKKNDLKEIELHNKLNDQIHFDLFLKRKKIHWEKYNETISYRYWACGTSLIAVAENDLVKYFFEKSISDICYRTPLGVNGFPPPLTTCSFG